MSELSERFEPVFHPKSVAVVGAKRLNNYNWLRAQSTFQGPVYHVNIDKSEWPGAEALGFPNFLSLLDIPDPVDYVIVSVPNSVVPRIVADGIKKGVKVMHLFTSGFGEAGTEEGRRLGKLVEDMAREAGLMLIGPNCMGVTNPRVGLRNSPEAYAGEWGPVSFLSQSGMHSIDFTTWAYRNGIKVSKVVSYGNGAVLDSTDFLEYLAQDPETEVIGLYIEGVRDGRRFFQVLRALTPQKPVFAWKGGQTGDGFRAANTHTGSLAISPSMWEAVLCQCGVVSVDSLEELVDSIKAYLNTVPGTGHRVALLGATGGHSTVMTDAFARAGLSVPSLTDASYQKLAGFFNVTGGSYKNPIDGLGGSPENLPTILDILDGDANIDAIAVEILPRMGRTWPDRLVTQVKALAAHRAKSAKPLIAVTCSPYTGDDAQLVIDLDRRLLEAGVPAFPSVDRGARALKKVIDYRRFCQEVA